MAETVKIYTSTTVPDIVKFDAWVGRLLNYHPDTFAFLEFSAETSLDLIGDFTTEIGEDGVPTDASKIGNFVIHLYTNGPTELTEAVDPVILKVYITYDTAYTLERVLKAGSRYFYYKDSTWVEVTSGIPDPEGESDIKFDKGPTPPQTTENIVWIDTSNPEHPSLKIYYNSNWVPIMEINAMTSDVYDPTGKNTSMYGYVNDKISELNEGYGQFLKHKANELELIHISASEREQWNAILDLNQLEQIVSETKSSLHDDAADLFESELGITTITQKITALKEKYDQHTATHITQEKVNSWDSKAPAIHEHKSDGRVEIDASKIVSGYIHTDRLPDEIKERVYQINSLDELASDTITDEDRKKKYHTGNTLVIWNSDDDYTLNKWYRIIDQTKIGTPSYAEGILEFSNDGSTPTEFPWSNVANKPTSVSGFGITDLYTKTEFDSTMTPIETIMEKAGTALAEMNQTAELSLPSAYDIVGIRPNPGKNIYEFLKHKEPDMGIPYNIDASLVLECGQQEDETKSIYSELLDTQSNYESLGIKFKNYDGINLHSYDAGHKLCGGYSSFNGVSPDESNENWPQLITCVKIIDGKMYLAGIRLPDSSASQSFRHVVAIADLNSGSPWKYLLIRYVNSTKFHLKGISDIISFKDNVYFVSDESSPHTDISPELGNVSVYKLNIVNDSITEVENFRWAFASAGMNCDDKYFYVYGIIGGESINDLKVAMYRTQDGNSWNRFECQYIKGGADVIHSVICPDNKGIQLFVHNSKNPVASYTTFTNLDNTFSELTVLSGIISMQSAYPIGNGILHNGEMYVPIMMMKQGDSQKYAVVRSNLLTAYAIYITYSKNRNVPINSAIIYASSEAPDPTGLYMILQNNETNELIVSHYKYSETNVGSEDFRKADDDIRFPVFITDEQSSATPEHSKIYMLFSDNKIYNLTAVILSEEAPVKISNLYNCNYYALLPKLYVENQETLDTIKIPYLDKEYTISIKPDSNGGYMITVEGDTDIDKVNTTILTKQEIDESNPSQMAEEAVEWIGQLTGPAS